MIRLEIFKMKSKYMSRKFIIAILGVIEAVVGIAYGNNVAVIVGTLLAGCFVIGESLIDKASAVKRSININDNKGANNGETKA